MARREYTVSLTKQGDWDRATIYEDGGEWYYCLRAADPHGEEYTDEPVGPFPTATAAETKAREEFIPREP